MDSVAWLQGLTEAQAARLLRETGPNIIREPKFRSLMDIGQSTLKEPMFLLLVSAAVLYLALGDLAEGLFMTGGAILSLLLVVVQEARSERALRALNALAEPRARVIRDGEIRSIPAREVVPGDIIQVEEGSRIAADAVLVSGDALEVDESALTGEANANLKVAARDGTMPTLSVPGEGANASLFASTMVVRGQGLAKVVKTGAQTQVGRIGTTIGEIGERPTLLQQDFRRLVRTLGVLAVLFCMIVAIAYGLVRGDWVGGALSGLTLAISLVPEEFPMVLAIFMALGGLRLAGRNVLVRRSAVVETLGATTLLCVDKTGTITENRMRLRFVWADGALHELSTGVSDRAAAVIATAQLASDPRPHDPMDAAIHAAAANLPDRLPIRVYPLRPDFLAFVQVWPAPSGSDLIYAAKGAHETVLALCDDDERLIGSANEAVDRLAAIGMRVLAVAEARVPGGGQPSPAALRYSFKGLLGFQDPVRPDVHAALREAREAGVSVALITGDFPVTALAAAAAAGIDTSGGVLTGADLVAGRDPKSARVFARIMPDQKLHIVQAMRDAGQIVAMTGDGINDAPALAAADIGIAMGLRGTDVARESADIILLDDRFASIVAGIGLGRRIFANLRRAMTYIAAIHIPIAGLALLPILAGLPPIFYPMHLVMLELLIDPICALVFEGQPSEPDAMRKPPRDARMPLFGRAQLQLSLLQGSVILAAVFAYYASLSAGNMGEEMARASAFIALVSAHLALAVAQGSPRAPLLDPSRLILLGIVAAAALLLTLSVMVPALMGLLRFAPMPAEGIAASVVIGVIAGGWYRAWHHLRQGGRFLRLGKVQS